MRKIQRLAFALSLCLLGAATAQAKGYVLSDGAGHCITATFHYDEQGAFIGTSSVSAACDIPAGSYAFDLVVAENGPRDPTPLDPTTKKPLSARDSLYGLSLRVTEVVRAADRGGPRGGERPVAIPREYALLMAEGLRGGKRIAVSVPSDYLSRPMTERLRM